MGAVALWSTVATAFKWSLAEMRPIELISIASTVSWVFLGGLLLYQRQDRRMLLRGWGTALWAGMMNPVAYYLVLFAAYDLLPGQEAMAINYTWALALALLSVPLLGHRLTAGDMLSSLVSYFGVWVIATRGDIFNMAFESPTGVACALISTVIWALYWLLNRQDHRPPLVAQWQNFTVALPVLWALVAWQEGFHGYSTGALAGSIYVGLFEMGVSFVLWQMAVHRISRTSKISNLIFLSPPISLLLLHVVIGEPISLSTLWGLMAILAGLILQQVAARRDRRHHPTPLSDAG
nr:DMT family transporter [Larsenimonas rhizosphaerae]